MKSWALCAFLVSSAALVACGSSGGGGGGAGGGAGGGGTTNTTSSSTTTTVSSTSSSSGTTTTTSSSSSSGGDACADGTDCTACTDRQSCFACNSVVHPTGAPLYEAVAECVICTGCYTVCGGATQGCTAAPPTTDACDTGSGQAACTTCQTCSQGGTCKPQLMACQNSQDCVGFYNDTMSCPAQ